MSNLTFYLIILMFKLKSALQHEIGEDSSRRVIGKMKNHYKEIDKRKPKKKGHIRIPQNALNNWPFALSGNARRIRQQG